MNDKSSIITQKEIENRIFTIRSKQVMLDSDLAEMYEVETKVLNQAVKRNILRFPESFRFQLSENEKNQLVTNCDRLKNLRHSSTLPHAFTEQGVAMLSAILRSNTAIKVSIQIINTFVEMRKLVLENATLFQRLDNIEIKQLETDQKFEQIFKALESKDMSLEQGIFYNGQVFDAYVFFARTIKQAKQSIVLIDNFVDETVLTLLSKRNKTVKASIYTKQITKQLKLDLKKHNEQYPAITVRTFSESHDRFLIIDNKELYHMGASLKDLGKKWFAFSKMDFLVNDVLNKLK